MASDTGRLLVAYIMVLERDALNNRHLIDVGPSTLLDGYITECFFRGENAWPTEEDMCNVLAIALLWHRTCVSGQ